MREGDIMGIKRGVMDETLGHVTTLASKSRRAKDRERERFFTVFHSARSDSNILVLRCKKVSCPNKYLSNRRVIFSQQALC